MQTAFQVYCAWVIFLLRFVEVCKREPISKKRNNKNMQHSQKGLVHTTCSWQKTKISSCGPPEWSSVEIVLALLFCWVLVGYFYSYKLNSFYHSCLLTKMKQKNATEIAHNLRTTSPSKFLLKQFNLIWGCWGPPYLEPIRLASTLQDRIPERLSVNYLQLCKNSQPLLDQKGTKSPITSHTTA